MAASDGASALAFEYAGCQYALCLSHGSAGHAAPGPASHMGTARGRWRKVPPPTASDSEYFRRRLQHVSTVKLRDFVARGGLFSPSVALAQMYLQLAVLVRSGRLDLFQLVEATGATHGSARGASSPQPTPEYEPPPAAVCPADLVVNKPPQPMVAKPATSPNPQAQAKVLVEAAQQGVPFCELCSRS